MNILLVGHDMVGHKSLEELHPLQPMTLEARALCEEPLMPYDRDHSIRSYPVQIRAGEVLAAVH